MIRRCFMCGAKMLIRRQGKRIILMPLCNHLPRG